MHFELTVTLVIPAETLGAAVLDVEARLRAGVAPPLRLSAMTGKVVTEPKGKAEPV